MTRTTSLSTAILAAVAAVAIAWSGARPGGAAPPEAEATSVLPVEARAVQRETGYALVEQHAGRVVARRASDLGFERAGRLVEVRVDQGDAVEAGALLARLDTRELRARRRELAAQRAEIEARLSLARLTSARRQKLHDAGHLAPQALDETRFAEAALDAQRAAADAALESLDVRLVLSELRAPFAGHVVERRLDEGTVVSPGQPVLRLEDRTLEVHVGVPPEVALNSTPGETLPIEVDGETLRGEITAVVRRVETDTRTVRLVIALTDAPPGLRPGALARVPVQARVAVDGFWLPIAALSEGRRGLWSAYALVRDAESERDGLWIVDRRQLDLLHAEADRAYVRGTLRDEERVVMSGVHRLVPRQRVRLAPDTAVSAPARPDEVLLGAAR